MTEALVNDVRIGETYRLVHSRKGKAVVKVLGISGEWIDVEIVEGELKGIGSGSLREVGDTERVRDSLARFLPVK